MPYFILYVNAQNKKIFFDYQIVQNRMEAPVK